MTEDIRRFILARVKFARQRLAHDRRTHFGLATTKRGVAEDFCTSNLRSRRSSDSPEYRLEHAENAERIKAAIDDFTNDLKYRKLIRRRFFNQECIKHLAKEFGVPAQSARRKVSQARAFIKRRLS